MISTVRGDLDWIIMKALEKERDRRYGSAQDFATDIRRHLANEPVQARPPSPGYLFRRFVARNRGAVTAAALILLTLIAGLGASITLLFKESAARKQADYQSAKSKQIATILGDMLKSAGPSIAKGRDTTLLNEILEKTEKRIETDLQDQPEIEAEICSFLGSAYQDLGDFNKSYELFNRAYQNYRRILPDDSPRFVGALYNLSTSLDFLDRLQESEAALSQSIEIQAKMKPTPEHAIANNRELLAWLMVRRGNLLAAEKEVRLALEYLNRRDATGSIDRGIREDRAQALMTLGTILLKAAEFDESEHVEREALRIYEEQEGELHPNVVTAVNNLCHTLVKVGKFDEAESLARKGLADQEILEKKTNGPCTDSLNKVLAQVHQSRGDYSAAIDCLRVAIDAAKEVYGEHHRFTNDKRSLMAQIQIDAGLIDEASATLAEANEDGVNAESADNSIGVASARLALAQGDLEKAEFEAREDAERAKKASVMPSIEQLDAMQTLAAVLLARGETSESESLLLEAIRIVKPDKNPKSPLLAALNAELAKVRAAKNAASKP
jgi:tetratricopeptide (TPR) repeat protein